MKLSLADKLIVAVGTLVVAMFILTVVQHFITMRMAEQDLPKPGRTYRPAPVRRPEFRPNPEARERRREPIEIVRSRPVFTGTHRLAPLPDDCVLFARVQYDAGFFRCVGGILFTLDGETNAAWLKRGLGRLLGNPRLEGVSLRHPVDVFLLDASQVGEPWVYQFTISDLSRLKAAYRLPDKAQAAEHNEYEIPSSPALAPAEGWRLRAHGDERAFRLVAPVVLRGSGKRLAVRFAAQIGRWRDELIASLPDDARKEGKADLIAKVTGGLAQAREVEIAGIVGDVNAGILMSIEPTENTRLLDTVRRRPGLLENAATELTACLLAAAAGRWEQARILRHAIAAVPDGVSISVDRPDSKLALLKIEVPAQRLTNEIRKRTGTKLAPEPRTQTPPPAKSAPGPASGEGDPGIQI